MELPPEAQKAADEAGLDESAMEGDESPSGTEDQSAVKVTTPKGDEAPASAPAEVAEGAGSKEGADASTGTISASGNTLSQSLHSLFGKQKVSVFNAHVCSDGC